MPNGRYAAPPPRLRAAEDGAAMQFNLAYHATFSATYLCFSITMIARGREQPRRLQEARRETRGDSRLLGGTAAERFKTPRLAGARHAIRRYRSSIAMPLATPRPPIERRPASA